MLTALGVDGGFAFIGWTLMAISENEEDDCVIDMGKCETKKAEKKRKILVADDDHRRGREIAKFFYNMIRANGVHIVCMEAKSLPRNASTSAKLGACSGIFSALCEILDLPMAMASPQELKKHVTGRISVTDERLNECLLLRYEEAEHFTQKIVKSKRQHAFDSLGAIDVCKTGEVFRALRSAGWA